MAGECPRHAKSCHFACTTGRQSSGFAARLILILGLCFVSTDVVLGQSGWRPVGRPQVHVTYRSFLSSESLPNFQIDFADPLPAGASPGWGRRLYRTMSLQRPSSLSPNAKTLAFWPSRTRSGSWIQPGLIVRHIILPERGGGMTSSGSFTRPTGSGSPWWVTGTCGTHHSPVTPCKRSGRG